MKYCSHCGSQKVSFHIPPGDNRARHVCGDCSEIFYQNPRIICGSLVHKDETILLCKRGIAPREGYWTLPAGFMENGETTSAAAHRETWEEAQAEVHSDQLYCIFNLPHINQVYFFYLGHLVDNEYGAGEETTETKLFHMDDIPWKELAFPTIERALSLYIEDFKTNNFPVRIENILVSPETKSYEAQAHLPKAAR